LDAKYRSFSGARDPFAETTKNKNRLTPTGVQANWRDSLSWGINGIRKAF
jgi:hypothetical protein